MATTTTAFKLAKYCLDDKIPDCPEVCKDYGFSRCSTEYHYSYLFGLYQKLVRLPGFNTYNMHIAFQQGKLFSYIQQLYDEHDPENFYYKWVQRYKNLFTNASSAT